MAASANSSYKLRKEEFVSNLEGTSMVEIALLSAIVPGFMVLGQIVASSSVHKDAGKRGLWPELVRSVGIELTVAILPILACLTVLVESIKFVLATLICVLLGCFFLLRPRLCSTEGEEQVFDASRKSFLSAYRCAMMLVTCITILAVDFTVYPRRLAKTETYGTGLMDVGVGSFVVANALVSRQARGVPPSQQGGTCRGVRRALELLLHPGRGDSSHIGRSNSCLCQWTSRHRHPCSIPGIYSTLGYWALYLISVQLGHIINHQPGQLLSRFRAVHNGKALEQESARWYTALEVCGLDALLWILAAVVNEFVERVSRRTCNLAYVLFVLGQNFQVMGSFALAEAILPLRNMVWMDAFDHNLLPTFLLANVLTGLVNISTDTIAATPAWAFSTLVAYLAFLAGGITLADAFHLRLKFW